MENTTLDDRILSKHEIRRILDQHGISHRDTESGMEMLESWTQTGHANMQYVPVITNLHGLLIWLGY